MCGVVNIIRTLHVPLKLIDIFRKRMSCDSAMPKDFAQALGGHFLLSSPRLPRDEDEKKKKKKLAMWMVAVFAQRQAS